MALRKWDAEEEETGFSPLRALMRDPDILLPPKPPKGPNAPRAPRTPETKTPTGSIGGSGTGGSGGSGGSGGGDPYKSYLRQQKREQRKAGRKSAERYRDLAGTLGLQADAIRSALGKDGLKAKLKGDIGAVDRMESQQRELLTSLYDERYADLERGVGDNGAAANAQGYAALSNRGRERANALSEVAMQGGGESDVLRAQGMSLRNWQANQSEVNRSFHDSLSSINSSLGDLNADTRTALIDNATQAAADRRQLWQGFYDARSEMFTALGNTLGQMAEYYGMADEAAAGYTGGGKKGKGSKGSKGKGPKSALGHRGDGGWSTRLPSAELQERYSRQSGRAFDRAADFATRSAPDPGIDPFARDWQGAGDFEGQLNNSVFSATGTQIARPEGATLRRWDA